MTESERQNDRKRDKKENMQNLGTKTEGRKSVDSSWNVMAHGDAREEKWRGNWRMEWVASILHTTSKHGVSSITTADAHTSAASSQLNWRPAADLNGLVRFAERRNLVSARVPSHFNWPLPKSTFSCCRHPEDGLIAAETCSFNWSLSDKGLFGGYMLVTLKWTLCICLSVPVPVDARSKA